MIYDELIPADHLLRKLATAVGLSFVSDLVSDCYCPEPPLDTLPALAPDYRTQVC